MVTSASDICSFESRPLTAAMMSGDVSIPSFYASSFTRPSFLELDELSSLTTVSVFALTGSAFAGSDLGLLFYCEMFSFIFSFIIGLDYAFLPLTVSLI